MAVLIRPKAWANQKPPAGSTINWGHPLAQGLSVAFPFNEFGGMPRDAARHRLITSAGAGAVSWLMNQKTGGMHCLANTVAAVDTEGSGITLPLTSATFAFGHNLITNTGGGTIGNNAGGGGGGTTTIDLYVPFTDNTVYFDFGGNGGANRLSVGSLPNLIGDNDWAFTAGLRGSTIWQNGLLRASQATAITRTAGTKAFVIGRNEAVAGCVQTFRYFYLYLRELVSTDIWWLKNEPYAMFTPPSPNKFYVSFSPDPTPVVTTAARTLVLGRRSGMGTREHSIRTPVGVSS